MKDSHKINIAAFVCIAALLGAISLDCGLSATGITFLSLAVVGMILGPVFFDDSAL